MVNSNIKEKEDNERKVHDFSLHKFRYTSEIKGKGIGFEYLGKTRFDYWLNTPLQKGESIFLDSKQIHSVFVPQNVLTAWFVYEGFSHSDYEPFCYTSDKAKYTNYKKDSKLYGKFTEVEIESFLKLLKLI